MPSVVVFESGADMSSQFSSDDKAVFERDGYLPVRSLFDATEAKLLRD
jgi:hypothetical protein